MVIQFVTKTTLKSENCYLFLSYILILSAFIDENFYKILHTLKIVVVNAFISSA